MDIFLQLDPLGTVIFVPAIVCLLLALQWGGVTYDWSNGRIIALFVVFGIAIVAFVALQIILGDKATVPTDIARQRTIAFASFFGLCIGGSFFIMIYFIPIWVSFICLLRVWSKTYQYNTTSKLFVELLPYAQVLTLSL